MQATFTCMPTHAKRTIRLLAAVLVLAIPLATGNTAQAQSVTVSKPKLPSGAPQGNLIGVSCPSATDCIAVGGTYRSNPQVSRALAERWNGHAWSILPFPTGRANVQINDVSCSSVHLCIAVGVITTDYDHPLAALWNGSRWTLQKVPWPENYDAASLWGVSCLADRTCVAVGSDEDASTALAERWNGRRWALMQVAQPTDGGSELNDISCSSSARCVAAGDEYSGCQVPYLERWNGQSWTIGATPPIPQFDGTGPDPCGRQNDSTFVGASCPRFGGCVVVGWRGVGGVPNDKPLVESRLAAGSWLLDPFPPVAPLINPKGADGFLNAVACPTVATCVVAGGADSGNRYVAFLGTLRDHRWVLHKVATQVRNPSLQDIACPTRRVCVAVGSWLDKKNHQLLLSARWHR